MTQPRTRGVTSTSFDPAIPLHHQVYLQLRSEIADGLWLDRSDFPGEKELARRLGISVITSRSALDRLVSDGWIDRQRGKRPRVVHRPEIPASGRHQHSIVLAGGLKIFDYEVLMAETAIAPAAACSVFDLPAGQKLWQCMRLRSYRGLPHSVTHNVQLPAIGQRHTRADLQTKPMITLLNEQGFIVASMRRRIGITHAPKIVTEVLGLPIAELVLMATFTLHDPNGVVLQWFRIYLHPDQTTPEETMDFTTGTWSANESM